MNIKELKNIENHFKGVLEGLNKVMPELKKQINENGTPEQKKQMDDILNKYEPSEGKKEYRDIIKKMGL